MIVPLGYSARNKPDRVVRHLKNTRSSLRQVRNSPPSIGELREGEHMEVHFNGEVRDYVSKNGKLYYTTTTEI